jgi:2-oxoglutarate dehydrogenase E2 component (dihydrolipoamide succinyltransferase)
MTKIKSPYEFYIKTDNVNDEFVIITDLLFENGDYVEVDQDIYEYETSKALTTINSEKNSGYIYYNCKIGDQVNIGALIATISGIKQDMPKNSIDTNKLPKKDSKPDIMLSKKAKDLLEKQSIEISVFPKDTFITEKVVEDYIKKNSPLYVHKKINATKIIEIDHLESVNSNGLNVTLAIDCNYKIIKDKNKHIWNTDISPSPLSLVLYHCRELLNEFDLLNSFYDDKSINIYKNINIGIAVDAGFGLKVIKIDKIDSEIDKIQSQLSLITKKYLSNDLNSTDMQDITFTITDLFNDGITFFTPLINKNNSSILGICSLTENKFKIVLTFDHRVVEGKYCARFLGSLKKSLEG